MTIRAEETVTCRSSALALWPLVTDTERLNRALGLGRMNVEAAEDLGAARYRGQMNAAGFKLTFEERPFEWVFLKHFESARKMLDGPVREIRTRVVFEPKDAGCSVAMHLTIEPRIGLFSPVLRLSAGQTLTRFRREVLRLDAALAAQTTVSPRASGVHDEVLTRLAKPLGDQPHVAKLVDFLRTADDVDVSRLRPYELADRWEVPRRDVLTMFLHAVEGGLVDLRWDVVCPSCRTSAERLPSLAELGEHGTCHLCDIKFAITLDEAVEATFAPAVAVRTVDPGPYCIGGPARVPHVKAQLVLPASGVGKLAAPKAIGAYRVFVRGGATALVDVTADGASEVSVTPSGDPTRTAVAPEGHVLVTNPDADERHAKLEVVGIVSPAVTARDLSTLAAFRRSFSSDVLRPGTSLKVARVTLFFSDLTASTELYASIGDAAAFRLVQDHFDVVLAIIERHAGAVVKTIGDAVMAAFSNELDGLAASTEILASFEEFRQKHVDHARTHIKLGLYSGPCYVVTANGILDYFGQTVNVAARLQAQAMSGELVCSAAFIDEALAHGALPPSWVKERYEAALKGVPKPIAVARIAQP